MTPTSTSTGTTYHLLRERCRVTCNTYALCLTKRHVYLAVTEIIT